MGLLFSTWPLPFDHLLRAFALHYALWAAVYARLFALAEDMAAIVPPVAKLAAVQLLPSLTGFVLGRLVQRPLRQLWRRTSTSALSEERIKRTAQQERENVRALFHELRNPLNGVVAHLRLAAAEREAGESPAGHSKSLSAHLDGALDSTVLCLEFLDTLSQIEKLEALEAINTASVELRRELRRVAKVVEPQLPPGVALRLELPPPSHVRLDGTVLKQILLNLLQNAARFTDAGSVTLRCEALGSAPPPAPTPALPGEELPLQRYRLSVTDTGVGMSAKTLASVFDRYTSKGGVGLGMYLSSRLVRLLGAELLAESPVPTAQGGAARGSRFSFELALAPAAAPGTASPDAVDTVPSTGSILAAGEGQSLAAGSLSRSSSTVSAASAASDSSDTLADEQVALPLGMRVLVADDSRANRKLLRAALERHCSATWAVREASSAEEAIALCEAEAFDLVVMDEEFAPGEMRGTEALVAIRKHEAQLGDARRPAAMVSCSGNQGPHRAHEASCASLPGVLSWSKPFPDFIKGDMQRQLGQLLRARSIAPSPSRTSAASCSPLPLPTSQSAGRLRAGPGRAGCELGGAAYGES